MGRGALLLLGLAAGLVLAAGQVRADRDDSEPVPDRAVTLDLLPLEVPLGALSPAALGRAQAVLGASIFAHRVEGIRYRSREEIFRFLLDHPDFAAAVARAARVGEYRLTRTEEGYWGDDARGAVGEIRLLHADPGRRLFHLQGRYEKRLLPAIEGQLLILFEFSHRLSPLGDTVTENRLTGHLRLDTPILGTLAGIVATLTRPLVERAVERKVRRFFRTVARVSGWAYDDPEGLAALLDGHPEVPQDETLEAFRRLLLAHRLPPWAEGLRLVPPEE